MIPFAKLQLRLLYTPFFLASFLIFIGPGVSLFLSTTFQSPWMSQIDPGRLYCFGGKRVKAALSGFGEVSWV